MDLKSMKVADLKAELAKRGLATDGLKAELVNRLQARLDEEEFGVAFETTTTTTTGTPTATSASTTVAPVTATTTTSTTTIATPLVTEPTPSSTTIAPVTKKASETSASVNSSTKDTTNPILKKEEEKDNSNTTTTTTTTATDVNNNQILSFEEKKRIRAERFGISVVGGTSNDKKSDDGATSTTKKKNKHDDKGSIIVVSNKKQKSIFGDTILPKDEIEKRLERASKFGSKDDDPITLELKAMLRKYKYGQVPVQDSMDGDGAVNAANTATIDDDPDLLSKEEIELRLQRAEKFGLVDDEQTIKLKAMLRRYRFK